MGKTVRCVRTGKWVPDLSQPREVAHASDFARIVSSLNSYGFPRFMVQVWRDGKWCDRFGTSRFRIAAEVFKYLEEFGDPADFPADAGMNQTSRFGAQMSFESEIIARSDNVTFERLPAHGGDIYRVKIRLDNEWILYSASSSEKDEREEYREAVEIYG